MSGSSSSPYSDPKLHDKIKDQVLFGDKGGRSNQWSARKAQLVATEYKKQGGNYISESSKPQQSLTKWTNEDWQTSDGGKANRSDGMHRYLPRLAWRKLSPEERKSTKAAKLQGDKAGKQFVPNTEQAKEARKEVSKSNLLHRGIEMKTKNDGTMDQRTTNGGNNPNGSKGNDSNGKNNESVVDKAKSAMGIKDSNSPDYKAQVKDLSKQMATAEKGYKAEIKQKDAEIRQKDGLLSKIGSLVGAGK